MLGNVYIAMFLISLAMLAILLATYKNRISLYYVLLFCDLLIFNFGYMQLSHSQSVEMAIFSNQTVYLAGSFSPFFLIMCLADLCKAKVRKWVQIFFLTFGGVIFTMTSSIGVVDWYYRKVSIAQFYGATFLVKEYGPLHKLFAIYLLIVMVYGIYIIIGAFKNKRDVSYITSILLLLCMLTAAGIYGFEKQVPIAIYYHFRKLKRLSALR